MRKICLLSAGSIGICCLILPPTAGLAETAQSTAVSSEQTLPTQAMPTTSPAVLETDLEAAPTDTLVEQVTSVTQLSDVQPTDWAFQALQSLVERYGVITGYPDGTFRGNR